MSPLDTRNPSAFIRANTEVEAPALVPEIKLHLASEIMPIWEATERELDEAGLAPPYWAFAWAGGQALARWLLDNPEIVAGRSVLDFAAGGGIAGIAAARAGAARVLAEAGGSRRRPTSSRRRQQPRPWPRAAVSLRAAAAVRRSQVPPPSRDAQQSSQ